jgi:hypothetical protein
LDILFYIISFLFSNNKDFIPIVIFIISIIIFIINVKSFYTVNLSAKEFKKKMYLPWLSFGLTFIYSLFILIVSIIESKNGVNPFETLMIGNLIVIWLGLLLYIPGILTKVIDNKISYEEHINKTNSTN